MQSSLRSLAFVFVLAACGDEDGPEDPAPVDGSTPSTPDAGNMNIDAARPAPPDASVSADGAVSDAAVVLPSDVDASIQDAATPTADQLLGAATEAKVRSECQVFGEGKLPSDFFAVRDSYERCVASCVVGASCAALKGTFCRTNQNPTSVDSCISACTFPPADGFACGDGSTITFANVCDLQAQCANGSDQASCELFRCTNGKQIPARLVCDGLDGCGDRSDETNQGCAACN
jgi:hypothetical protein